MPASTPAAAFALLQRTTGNRATSALVVQRESTAELDTKYQAAVAAGRWNMAAVHLNGFNNDDIAARIKLLSHAQHILLYNGAIAALTGAGRRPTKAATAVPAPSIGLEPLLTSST